MYFKDAFLSILNTVKKHKRWIQIALVFTVSCVVFAFIQHPQGFPDPDSYYHAKMALLVREQGIVSDFPWLPYTTLAQNYTDHHLLYHVFIVPFVSIFDPLAGLRIATIFLAAIFITTFYATTRRLDFKAPWFWTLLLIGVNAFIFRLNLGKASALSLTLFFASLVALLEKRYLPVFLLSFLYVWSYGGWILVLVATLLVIASDYIPVLVAKIIGNNGIHTLPHWKRQLKLVFACIGGLVLGLVLNPYFPKNLNFYWQQVVDIGIVNYQTKIGVGGEWYPYDLSSLVSDTKPLFIFIALAFILFALKLDKQPARVYSAVFLFFLTTFAVLKSRRYVEYFVPSAIFFIGAAISTFETIRREVKSSLQQTLSQIRSENTILLVALFFMSISLLLLLGKNISSVSKAYEDNYSYTEFARASFWLKNNTAENSIVFHSDWDEFPILFYHNTHNRYISGLDPTFMYKANPELHQKYADITLGTEVDHLYEYIKDDFNAEYVFIDDTHAPMKNNIESNFNFEKVYEDDEASVYRVVR